MEKTAFSEISSVDDIHWERWNFTERAALCIVRKKGDILLIHKKSGLGAGFVNIPGGRIDMNETPETAAVREIQEETCITPLSPQFAAQLQYMSQGGYSMRVFVFTASGYEGDPAPTQEADPFWCAADAIPYDKIWPRGYESWLGRVLAGERILGRFIFDENKNEMLDMEIIKYPEPPYSARNLPFGIN
ncbi:MAG: 8-oxo-dGTP diphosphatase [Chitinispirillales bacterium]|jgi:8-oxo-dGTP diphosphatase|nr:8-oxo-dGTP diphosphatase [Chitinispirillales bacterium]